MRARSLEEARLVAHAVEPVVTEVFCEEEHREPGEARPRVVPLVAGVSAAPAQPGDLEQQGQQEDRNREKTGGAIVSVRGFAEGLAHDARGRLDDRIVGHVELLEVVAVRAQPFEDGDEAR